jgi:putative membrane-bound dehydrogenase-like protein
MGHMKIRDTLLGSLICTSALFAANENALTPEQSVAKLGVAPGLEAQVFAAEPAIQNLTDMNWDHKGRLWVTETVDYPYNINPQDPISGGNDRIKILEDTDGDGVADKVTVFASGLNIPAGVAFTETGILVNVTGAIYHLEDTDGDDKMDKSTPLYTGFPTGDTHVQENGIQYGLDNNYWVAHGGVPGVQSPNGNNGIFKFKLGDANYKDILDLNFIGNNWHMGFNEQGDHFWTDVEAGLWHTIISNSQYAQAGINPREGSRGYRGITRIANNRVNPRAQDIIVWDAGRKLSNATTGAMTSAVNTKMYTARLFPEEYHNKALFQAEPGGRFVARSILSPSKSTFSVTRPEPQNLVTSSDSWFAPIKVVTGPDGAIWILDWHDINIAHNNPFQSNVIPGQNAFEMPRDTARGRIYRVFPTTPRTVDPIPVLDPDNINQLVRTLHHDNRFWRLTAQRLLTYKKDEKQAVVDAILPTLSYANRSGESENWGTIHAVWTLEGLGVLEDNIESIYPLLRHPSDAVVMNILQALPKNQATVDAITVARILESTNPHLRIKTLLTLADMPSTVSGALAMRSADKQDDQIASDAVTIAETRISVLEVTSGSGERVIDYVLGEEPPSPVSLSNDLTNVRNLAASTLYVRGNITGRYFGTTTKGLLSFYSTNGTLIGKRTLENQIFVEGPLSLSSSISFYRLENLSNTVSGKIVRID